LYLCRILIDVISAILTSAPIMAHALISSPIDELVKPNTSADDAASAAPEETPNVNGLAR
jgi:hypothetical protein